MTKLLRFKQDTFFLFSSDQFNRHPLSLRIILTINFDQQNMHNILKKLYNRIHLEKNYTMVYIL
jgi:hypothetical protein